MKHTKLLRALSTLDKEEWMSLRKYIVSNTGVESEIYSLFSIIQARKLNFAGLKSPEKFKSKYYSNISQKAFYGMLSKLYKWLEEWLSIYEMRNTEYEKQIYLIKALYRKGLVKEARSHIFKLKKRIKDEDVLSFTSNKILAELEDIQYFNLHHDNAMERHQILISACLKNAQSYKEKSQFYIAELINRGRIYSEDFNEVKSMLQSSIENITDSSLSLYGSSLVDLLEKEELVDLSKLEKAMLSRTFKRGSKLEILLVAYVRIYSRKLFSQNKIEDLDLYYSLFNFNFSVEIENSGGKISVTNFHNIVDEIANFLPFDKANDFIDKWIDQVDTSMTKETKDLAYSQLFFIKRDFDQMFNYSKFIAFDNYGQRSRAWLHNVICLYKFRKENYDVAKQALFAFKNYLKRNKKKFSKNFFTANINLVNLMEKLMKNDFKPQEIKLEDYKVIFYRTWSTEELEKAKRK